MLHTGPGAFDAALNTVNIGKFNLGFASIGICEHALHEAITHADSRVLYGIKVTDFPHVRQAFTDSYARLIAMKLFANRAIDYMRSASPEDRRYLLFNPLTKMKVTTEGERVIDALWDVMAAKGFERDMFFEMAARDIRGLPKLEGTVHVNMALVLKFMAGLPVQRRTRSSRRRSGSSRPATTSSCSARGRRADSRRSASARGATPSSRSPASPTSPASSSWPSRSSGCSSTPLPTRTSSATSTTC